MFGLTDLVLRPLPGKAQHGDAPLVLHHRVELAVGALVGDHLAPAGEIHERAVIAAGVLLEFQAVAAAREVLEAAARAHTGHAAAAAEFDVVAAGEAELARELFLIEPPRRVDVRAAGPILVVRRQTFQRRDLPADAGPDGIHDVLANEPAGVGEALRELRRLGIEEQPHRLHAAGGEHDDASLGATFFARGLVNIDHAVGAAPGVQRDLAHHRVGDDVEVAGGQGWRQVDRGGLIIGADGATAAAGRGPETRGALAHGLREDPLRLGVAGVEFRREHRGILPLRQHGPMDRHDRHPEGGHVLLGVALAGPRGGRRLQHARRGIGRIFQAVVVAIDTDEHLDLVVVGRDFLVSEGPVKAEAVAAARLEIIGAIAQGMAGPVVGAATHHAGAPPFKLPRRILVHLGIGLVRHLPAAIHRGVMETEGLVGRRRTTQRGLAVGLEHRRLLHRVVVAAGLEHEDLRAFHGEGVGGLATGGAGADDNYIVFGFDLAGGDKRHGAGRSGVRTTEATPAKSARGKEAARRRTLNI